MPNTIANGSVARVASEPITTAVRTDLIAWYRTSLPVWSVPNTWYHGHSAATQPMNSASTRRGEQHRAPGNVGRSRPDRVRATRGTTCARSGRATRRRRARAVRRPPLPRRSPAAERASDVARPIRDPVSCRCVPPNCSRGIIADGLAVDQHRFLRILVRAERNRIGLLARFARSGEERVEQRQRARRVARARRSLAAPGAGGSSGRKWIESRIEISRKTASTHRRGHRRRVADRPRAMSGAASAYAARATRRRRSRPAAGRGRRRSRGRRASALGQRPRGRPKGAVRPLGGQRT